MVHSKGNKRVKQPALLSVRVGRHPSQPGTKRSSSSGVRGRIRGEKSSAELRGGGQVGDDYSCLATGGSVSGFHEKACRGLAQRFGSSGRPFLGELLEKFI